MAQQISVTIYYNPNVSDKLKKTPLQERLAWDLAETRRLVICNKGSSRVTKITLRVELGNLDN